MKNVKVCEYVSSGHPDKLADRISDTILEYLMREDKNTRAGIECMVKDNIVILGGEVKTNAKINYDDCVRKVFECVSYPKSHNLYPSNIKIINLIGKQSNEISNGVDKEDSDEIGAGDQGFMVGFASNETPLYMPLGHYLAKIICKGIEKYGKESRTDNFQIGPDIKSQVTLVYEDDKNPIIDSILVSTMHNGISLEDVRELIIKMIKSNEFIKIPEEIHKEYITDSVKIIVNPCGSWNIGGPISDCGLTGRKIVVDNYGSYCTVGGGAYCGKDLTKVDRSGAYMCRFLAKNIVKSGICKEAKVELGYIISRSNPCALNIELKGCKYKDAEEKISKWIINNIDLTPKGIINKFPFVETQMETSTDLGHFGFSDNFDIRPWERIDDTIVKNIKYLFRLEDIPLMVDF